MDPLIYLHYWIKLKVIRCDTTLVTQILTSSSVCIPGLYPKTIVELDLKFFAKLEQRRQCYDVQQHPRIGLQRIIAMRASEILQKFCGLCNIYFERILEKFECIRVDFHATSRLNQNIFRMERV